MNGGVIRSSGSTPTQSVLLDYCKQSSFLPGLHINLSEGEPLSSKSSITSLLDSRTGLFYDKSNLRKNLSSIDLHHVEVEIENQIIQFEKIFRISPLRIDGHQHCHVLPGVVEVLLHLLRRHNISWIRIPEENILKHSKTREPTSSLKLVDGTPMKFYLEVSLQATSARDKFLSVGLQCSPVPFTLQDNC
ncbi:unnamed protein product [Hymenolepis diminuta]|uniref:Carbohydrate deacetylase n=1 Tax=Hymenolepis diminuta TaxID=6216 RepID=A0A564Z4S9_HYMDI|nr:unnamed protein product [Hymenolepis diminuta]